MRRRSNSVRLLAAALLVTAGVAALSAHEQKAALTDIFYNERSGNLEIAHRFIVHDAEHTLRKATGRKEGLVESKEAQAAFANYVTERFALRWDDQRGPGDQHGPLGLDFCLALPQWMAENPTRSNHYHRAQRIVC